MELSDYINENNVFFIDKKDRHQVLIELIDKAVAYSKITDSDFFKKSIEAREALLSTGIGLGVAIPHAKIDTLLEFFIITGILKSPVEWDSLDQKPVSIVFLIGGPANEQNQYLKILSKLMLFIKDNERRDQIIAAKNIEDILVLL